MTHLKLNVSQRLNSNYFQHFPTAKGSHFPESSHPVQNILISYIFNAQNILISYVFKVQNDFKFYVSKDRISNNIFCTKIPFIMGEIVNLKRMLVDCNEEF